MMIAAISIKMLPMKINDGTPIMGTKFGEKPVMAKESAIIAPVIPIAHP